MDDQTDRATWRPWVARNVAAVLREEGGEARMATIAKRLGVSRIRVSETIKDMHCTFSLEYRKDTLHIVRLRDIDAEIRAEQAAIRSISARVLRAKQQGGEMKGEIVRYCRVEREIKSQNLYRSWRSYASEAKQWRNILAYVMGRAPMACSIPRRITIHSYRTRLLDHGNLVGGAKPIPDALKHLGWIKDDSPHWVQIDYHQEVDAKQAPLTVVTVEEMGA